MLTDILTDAEQNKVHTPEQEWSDSFALKVCQADFQAAEIYRQQSHDERYSMADRLYVGWEKQRYWEGTKMPRSSLGMFVVLANIESLMPDILSAIFGEQPWFEVGPEEGTSAIDALRVRSLMLRQMEQMRKAKGQSIREVMRRAIKDGLMYGIGPVELGWFDETRNIRKITRERVPLTQTLNHPQYGPVELPTGQWQEQLREQKIPHRIQSPFLKHISAKDIYVDPNHMSPVFQGARFVCTRGFKTVDELDRMRRMEGFAIPPKERLLELARNKPATMADASRTEAEAARGGNWNPTVETSADPGAQRIEVVNRWSAERSVWMLNREAVAYNQRNEYGLIPIFNAFYIDVPGRCYGLSVTDLTESEHRFQGGVINARVDELAIHIHGRSVKKRGTATPSHQLRRKPGQVIEAENPKEDVIFDQITPALQQAFIETNASEARVQRTIGRSELIASGNAESGGNSAARSAAGINTLAAAGAKRPIYLIETIEDTFVEPILSCWHYLNTQFLDPADEIRIVSKDGNQTVDPLAIMNADVVFSMRASARMRARAALLQSFPLIAETFLNPQIMSQLNRMGITFDMEEWAQVILDMTGYRARGRFVRPMSPQEQAAYQQAQQQEQNIELVKQRERMQSMKELQDQKGADELQKAIVERGLEAALAEPNTSGGAE